MSIYRTFKATGTINIGIEQLDRFIAVPDRQFAYDAQAWPDIIF